MAATHITSGATVTHKEWHANHTLKLLLKDEPGAFSYSVIASPTRPAKVICEGDLVPQVDDLDAVGEGWQWLSAHGAAVVKTRYGQGGVTLACRWAD
jgi:hypothetical protein